MQTIVFVHGMYMNGKSWEKWQEYFSAKGFDCKVPSWPFHDGKPAELREHIPDGLGKLTTGEAVDYLETYITELGLAEKPIIIGHSVGGYLTQQLVARGLAAKAVVLSSAPSFGIIGLSPVFLRANFPHINPFAGKKPCVMTRKRFHYAFCNTLTLEQSDEAYDKYVTHESREIPRSLLKRSAKIDFKKAHCPLLFLAGDSDHLVPAHLNEVNARKYRKGGDSLVDLHIFPKRGHFIYGEPGWEEVADYTYDWLQKTPSS